VSQKKTGIRSPQTEKEVTKGRVGTERVSLQKWPRIAKQPGAGAAASGGRENPGMRPEPLESERKTGTEEEIKASCGWLTPVILATQEAEIRGSRLEASTGK
jgi:hypothetical protein